MSQVPNQAKSAPTEWAADGARFFGPQPPKCSLSLLEQPLWACEHLSALRGLDLAMAEQLLFQEFRLLVRETEMEARNDNVVLSYITWANARLCGSIGKGTQLT